MLSRELVAALTQARRKMPGSAWQQLAAQLAELEASPNSATIRQMTASLLNRDAAWILSKEFEKNPDAKWIEIAAAMTAVDCLAGNDTLTTEIIWTGPANKRFPVRRIDQVLYDLISQAKTRIVLVTFAAHRVRHLCDHLAEAVRRGVQITMIVECEEASEGQLTMDAMAAFQNVPRNRTKIYCWPTGQRGRNAAGRPGKLHVKCAVVDEVALIGSANLTDDAFNRNMELGMIVREVPTVLAITEHFQELIQAGVLVEVPQVEL